MKQNVSFHNRKVYLSFWSVSQSCESVAANYLFVKTETSQATPWRNGSASDSRSEGCVFESRRGHQTFDYFLCTFIYL